MTPDTTRTRVIAYLTVSVVGLALAVSGVGVQLGTARTALGVVSSVPILMNLYDRFAWHRRWVPFGPPDLRGVWRVAIHSDYVASTPSSTTATINAFVVFRQTAVALTATLHTEESSSGSVAASVSRTPDSRFEVSWMYRNEPQQQHRQQSPIHYGGARLMAFGGRKPERLEGTYFTDRATKGDLFLSDRRVAYPNSFSEATALYGH